MVGTTSVVNAYLFQKTQFTNFINPKTFNHEKVYSHFHFLMCRADAVPADHINHYQRHDNKRINGNAREPPGRIYYG